MLKGQFRKDYMETLGFNSETVLSQAQLWKAVKQRDPKYYASFVYAVKSTGIYCRPTCAARKPRPNQTLFFPNYVAAEKSGFRACRRCKPNDQSCKSPQETLVNKVREMIDENPEAKLSLNEFGRTFNTSPFYLQKIFKRFTRITPKEYVRAARIQRIKRSLKRGESIRQSIYDSGYSTSSWLYPAPSKNSMLGMAPSVYKAGGQGMTISYLIEDSPLGKVLVAATEFGLCAVIIGSSSERMIKVLREEFPRANFQQNELIVNSLGVWTMKILQCISGGGNLPNLGIPLDVMGTAFQHKVWKELQAIPLGQVRSYSEIAKRVGSLRGSRAVARACATNPVALVIPCHRVVRKNGEMGGYRWGVEKKKYLLEIEGAEPSGSHEKSGEKD
jgi:AraC family transcriptional regulator, regulatory protein of adaptative response / methylated-DNA-[protein]-cysteine methyltransferase